MTCQECCGYLPETKEDNSQILYNTGLAFTLSWSSTYPCRILPWQATFKMPSYSLQVSLSAEALGCVTDLALHQGDSLTQAWTDGSLAHLMSGM
jgi:hypothetical protein